MKKFLLPALFAVAVLAQLRLLRPRKAAAAKTAATAEPAYKLQPQLSTLGWEGKAVTHGHNGTMQFSSGELLVKGNAIVGGTVTVDMKTMKATDIKDAESQGKFVGHMSSDDFFGVEKYPTATFKIVSVTPIKGAANRCRQRHHRRRHDHQGRDAAHQLPRQSGRERTAWPLPPAR